MRIFMHMGTATLNPVQRRARVAALIGGQQVWSQQELAVLLKRREGVAVTQATLSRDLTELGVVKGPQGYMLPGTVPGMVPEARDATLGAALRQHFLSATRGGTMVIVRTPVGHANSLAVELDRAGMSGVLGTIAGDDTIFIASRDADSAIQLVRTLERLARGQASARGDSAS
jgi:transcriptional regulator of arginine metabolism